MYLRLKSKIFLIVLFVIWLFALISIAIKRNIYDDKQSKKGSERVNYSVFFLESNYNREEFTTKEMCAIESAAKTNPNATIQVYTLRAKLNEKTNQLLKTYSNIRINKFEPRVIFKDTPLLKWWSKGTVMKSPFSFAHIADAFRYLKIL